MEFGNPKDETQLIELLKKENELLREEKMGKIEEVLEILKDMEKYYEKQERECYRNILGQEVYDIF